jgi:hypothetical protein
MAYRLLLLAEASLRRLNGHQLLPLVRAGVHFLDCVRIERDDVASKTAAIKSQRKPGVGASFEAPGRLRAFRTVRMVAQLAGGTAKISTVWRAAEEIVLEMSRKALPGRFASLEEVRPWPRRLAGESPGCSR